MAEKVEIIITAKDNASQVLRGVAGGFKGIGEAAQMLTSGGAIEAVTKAVIEFSKQSIDATVQYADEVRRLSQISGQSSEETSRLIQLADDYKISTGELTIAMRKLTSEGLTLNVQTLAKLSDEYRSLNPGQERAAFLMEKFGRQGVKFAEIMGLGSGRINELNAGIDDNLILTQKAVDQAREYEKAMDSWEEQTQKLQYALGNQLLPALTSVIEEGNRRIDEGTIFDAKRMIPVYGLWLQLAGVFETFGNVVKGTHPEIVVMSDEMDRFNHILGITVETEKDQAAALEDLSKANSDYIKDVEKLGGIEKEYSTDMAKLTEERAQTQQALTDIISAGYDQNSSEVQDYQNKLSELDAQIQATAQKHTEAIQQIISDNILAKLSVDGLTQAEMDQYLSIELAFGRITEKDKEMLSGQQKLIDAFLAGKLGAQELKSAIEALPSTKNIDLMINLRGNGADYALSQQQTVRVPGRAPIATPRAMGGPVNAMEWYRVNETNQEYFRSSVGGSVSPIGPANSAGVNVIINTPAVIGDRTHVENYLLPVIREGLRAVQAGR